MREDFEAKNKQLLDEMPRFHNSRLDYFQPSFESLIRAQVKLLPPAPNTGLTLSLGTQSWALQTHLLPSPTPHTGRGLSHSLPRQPPHPHPAPAPPRGRAAGGLVICWSCCCWFLHCSVVDASLGLSSLLFNSSSVKFSLVFYHEQQEESRPSHPRLTSVGRFCAWCPQEVRDRGLPGDGPFRSTRAHPPSPP